MIFPPIAAAASAMAKSKARNVALDRARTFLTLLVLLHHCIIAYTHFGHTDPTSWIGFDIIILANDSFFMAMFFFLSGLFVWPGLVDKTPLHFVGDRLLRLGIPFLVCALTLSPLAYYALALQAGSGVSFASFWVRTITSGPWPSGPIWFVWVLLVLDLTASVLYRLSPRLALPFYRVSQAGFDQPGRFWLLLFLVTEIAYIPPLIRYGVNYWFELGPFAVQASRVLLYAAYFFLGVGIGYDSSGRGLLSPQGQLAKSRWSWLFAALIPYALMWCMIYVKRELLGNPLSLPWWYHLFYGTFFVAFSASVMFTVFGFCLNWKSPGPNVLDFMHNESYGMFLVHYPIVLWIQYWLFHADLPAITKATLAFVPTVILSWVAIATLRKIPGATRVL